MPTYSNGNDFLTSKGNPAPDFHLTSADYTAAEKAQLKAEYERVHSPAKVVADATYRYNCHAFAHAARHAWFNDITPFLRDDYFQYTPGQLMVGDVCVYVKDNVIQHSAVITRVTAPNIILEVQSKWGRAPELLHSPTNVPRDYGTIKYYLRKRTAFMKQDLTEEMNNLLMESLVFSLTGDEHLRAIETASTIESMVHIINSFPEIPALQLHGDIARAKLIETLAACNDSRVMIYAIALARIGGAEALDAIGKKMPEYEKDDGFTLEGLILLQAYDRIRMTEAMLNKDELKNRINEISRQYRK